MSVRILQRPAKAGKESEMETKVNVWYSGKDGCWVATREFWGGTGWQYESHKVLSRCTDSGDEDAAVRSAARQYHMRGADIGRPSAE